MHNSTTCGLQIRIAPKLDPHACLPFLLSGDGATGDP